MCRRLGVKLCQSDKCPLARRNYPPGIHGSKGKKRQTEYGLQLAEKQKAKVVYNILEKQFFLTFKKASQMQGDTGNNLLSLLELRLDNTVYRLGFADTRAQARQLVSHGHFRVNGRKVDIPSLILKSGDLISPCHSSASNKYFKKQIEKIKQEKIPGWLYVDLSKQEAKVLHAPKEGDGENVFDTKAIIEYYSRR